MEHHFGECLGIQLEDETAGFGSEASYQEWGVNPNPTVTHHHPGD